MQLRKLLEADIEEMYLWLDKKADIPGDYFWIFHPPKIDSHRICLVAHIDTFHSYYEERKKEVFFDSAKKVYWSPQGLGADDRAGVYAALEVFLSLPESLKPIILLTDGEEVGGTGAKAVCKHRKNIDVLKKVSYFIQLDRKGSKEVVFYHHEPPSFRKHIKKHGFIESLGSFSDISILCPEFELCGANLSIGFYNEHTEKEFLRVNEMERTIKKVINMCKEYNGEVWSLSFADYKGKKKKDFSYIDNVIEWLPEEWSKEKECIKCGKLLTKTQEYICNRCLLA